MPIEMITGTPGAGKTLLALQKALTAAGVQDQSSFEAIKAGLRNAKRRVVVCGVEGLKPGLFDTIEDPNEWKDLDDGTLLVVDEAWKWWGSHISAIKSDPRFLQLAEHRHFGMDLILTCQMPAQIQKHVLGLVAAHVHVTRKFGTNTTVTYEWSSVRSNPNSASVKAQAIEKIWTHPAPIYELYQSATIHTIKRKFPLKVLMIPVAALLAIALILLGAYAITRLYKGDGKGKEAGRQADDATAAGGFGRRERPLSPVEYSERLLPRFATLPGSAPLYDGREAAAEPELYCMSSEAGEAADGHREASVTCLTEQGTRYDISDGEARRVARYGATYNHFKRPQREQRQEPAGDRRPSEGQASNGGLSPVGAALNGPQVASYGDITVGK